MNILAHILMLVIFLNTQSFSQIFADKIFVDKSVYSIVAADNEVWFATEKGVFKESNGNYSKDNKHFKVSDSSGVYDIAIYNKVIWFFSRNIITNSKNNIFQFRPHIKDFVSSTIFISNRLYVAMSNTTTIHTFRIEDDKIEWQDTLKNIGVNVHNIYSLFGNKDGSLWVSTDDGIYVYDGNSFEKHPDISVKDIFNITEHKGFIYLAGKSGVWAYNISNRNIAQILDRRTFKKSYAINDIVFDEYDRLWFVADDVIGCMDSTKSVKIDTIQDYSKKNKSLRGQCIAYSAKDKRIIVGTGGQGVFLFNIEGKDTSLVKNVSSGDKNVKQSPNTNDNNSIEKKDTSSNKNVKQETNTSETVKNATIIGSCGYRTITKDSIGNSRRFKYMLEAGYVGVIIAYNVYNSGITIYNGNIEKVNRVDGSDMITNHRGFYHLGCGGDCANKIFSIKIEKRDSTIGNWGEIFIVPIPANCSSEKP